MSEISKHKPPQVSQFSTRARWNSGLRIVAWMIVLCGGLLFVVPEFQRMFEEFGIDLPLLCKLLMALSDKAMGLVILFIPFVFVSLICVELAILLMPFGSGRKNLNRLAWLGLVLVFAFYALSLGGPLFAIITGLTQSGN